MVLLLKIIFSDRPACRLPVFKRKEVTGRTRTGRLEFTEGGGTETSSGANIVTEILVSL